MTSPASRSTTPKAFEPYGFLLTGGRRNNTTAATSANALEGEGGSSTSSLPSQHSPPSPDACVKTAHGSFLNGACEFVVPPQLEPVERETPARCRTLFVGQLRFETTSAEVRWLVKNLSGVTALKVEARGPGCFILYLASESDSAAVRALHRRVLMDHQGFWFARTPAGVDTMLNYVETVLPRLTHERKRSLHLPLDTIVVEETRSRRIRKTTSGGPRPQQLQLQNPAPHYYGTTHASHPHNPHHHHHQQVSPMYSQPPSSASSVAYASMPTSPQVFTAASSALSTPEASGYPAHNAVGFHRSVPEYVTAGADPMQSMCF